MHWNKHYLKYTFKNYNVIDNYNYMHTSISKPSKSHATVTYNKKSFKKRMYKDLLKEIAKYNVDFSLVENKFITEKPKK